MFVRPDQPLLLKKQTTTRRRQDPSLRSFFLKIHFGLPRMREVPVAFVKFLPLDDKMIYKMWDPNFVRNPVGTMFLLGIVCLSQF
jgi:hypothetical protein